MAREFSRAFYASRAWEECRESFIKERVLLDGGFCQRCGQRLGYIVHHVNKITEANVNDSVITLAHENLEFLCQECHNQVHRADMTAGKGGAPFCAFTADGQPVDLRKV